MVITGFGAKSMVDVCINHSFLYTLTLIQHSSWRQMCPFSYMHNTKCLIEYIYFHIYPSCAYSCSVQTSNSCVILVDVFVLNENSFHSVYQCLSYIKREVLYSICLFSFCTCIRIRTSSVVCLEYHSGSSLQNIYIIWLKALNVHFSKMTYMYSKHLFLYKH